MTTRLQRGAGAQGLTRHVVRGQRTGTDARAYTLRPTTLRYGSQLPGGYATCTFEVPDTGDLEATILRLDDIWVTAHSSPAWEGRVEEINRADRDGAPVLVVVALGHAADLKQTRRRALIIDADPAARWRNAKDVHTGYGQSSIPQVAVATDATLGATLGITFPNGQALTTNDDCQLIYEAPPGTLIERVEFTWATTSTANISWQVMLADTLPATPAAAGWAETAKGSATFAAATSGTVAYDVTGANRRFLMIRTDVTAGFTPGADTSLRLANIRIIGANSKGGAPLTASQVTTRTAISHLIRSHGGPRVQAPDWAVVSPPALPPSAFAHLVFDQVTSIDQMLTQVCAQDGWEWAVYDRGALFAGPTETLLNPLVADVEASSAASTTQRWLVATRATGERIDAQATTDGVVNRVTVAYTDTSGRPAEVTVTRYDDPLNPLNDPGNPFTPRRVRDGDLTLPGVATSAQATAYGNAYLEDRSRPTVRGTVTLKPTVAYQDRAAARSGVMPAALAKAGMWVWLPDVVALLPARSVTAWNTYSSAPVHALTLIRGVETDAASGRTTLTVDSSRDRVRTLLARLQAQIR